MKISSIYSDQSSLKHLKLFYECTMYNYNSYDIIRLIIEDLALSEGELGGAVRSLFNIKAGERDDIGWVPGTGYKEKKRRQRRKKPRWGETGEDNKWEDLEPDDKEVDDAYEYEDEDKVRRQKLDEDLELTEADENVGGAIKGLLNIGAGDRDDMGATPGGNATAPEKKQGEQKKQSKQGKQGKQSKQGAEQNSIGGIIKHGLAKLQLALAPKADKDLELLFAFTSANGEEGARKQSEVNDLVKMAEAFEESLLNRDMDGNFTNLDWWNKLFGTFDIDDKYKIEILTQASQEYKNSGVSQESLIYELDFINENHLSDQLLKLLIEDAGFVDKMKDMFSRGKKNLHNFIQGQAEQIAYPALANAKRDTSIMKLTNARIAKMAVKIATDRLREKFNGALEDADLEPDNIIADYRDFEKTGDVSDDLKNAINLFAPVVETEVEEPEEVEDEDEVEVEDEDEVEVEDEVGEEVEDEGEDEGEKEATGDRATLDAAKAAASQGIYGASYERKGPLIAESLNALFEEVLNDSAENVIAKAEKLKDKSVDDLSFDEVAFLLKLHGRLNARQLEPHEARRILQIHRQNRIGRGAPMFPTADEIVTMMQDALWKRGKQGKKWIRQPGERGDLPDRLPPPN